MGDTSSPPPTIYAWNLADKDAAVTLSNTDHTAATSTLGAAVRGVTGHPFGHYYFEITLTTPTASNGSIIGIALASAALSSAFQTAGAWGFFNGAGTKIENNVQGGYGSPQAAPITIGVEYDNGTLTFWFPGPSTPGVAYSGITGTVYPIWCFYAAGTHDATINTGDSPFVLGLPSGASAWG